MNKNLIYAFILLFLIGAMYLITKSDKGPVHSDADYWPTFNIDDTAAVHKIFMVDKDQNEILLARDKEENASWILNEDYKARIGNVNTILESAKRIRIDRPAPKAAHNNIVREMASMSTKVEFYDKNEELIRSYYIGHPTNNYLGSYSYIEGSDQIFVTHIPGWDGHLSSRFKLDIEDYRSRNVFNFRTDEINFVKVDYPDSPDLSFEMEQRGAQDFLVRSLYSEEKIKANSNKALSYLNKFQNLNAEAYYNNFSERDSILKMVPYCNITVMDKKGRSSEMTAYLMGRRTDSYAQFDRQGNPMEVDVDKLYATINNHRDFVVIQRYVFGELFKQYKDFLVE